MTDGSDNHSARRYYLVGQAIGLDRGIDDFKFVNETEALPSRSPPIDGEWGSHTIPGWVEGAVRYIGLPKLKATPRFILGAGKKTTIDAYFAYGLTIVSDRLKRLMEAVDADGFEFVRVDATHGKSDPPELGPYWAYAVIRGLNCVDEARSDIDYYDNSKNPRLAGLNLPPHYRSLYMVRMIPEIVGNAAAFVLQRREGFVIFDERIVDAYRAQKMKGFSFSLLQEPVGRERKPPWSIWIDNHNYWHDRGAV